MSGLFQDAADFNEDISSWDTTQVASMQAMFSGARKFNGTICLPASHTGIVDPSSFDDAFLHSNGSFTFCCPSGDYPKDDADGTYVCIPCPDPEACVGDGICTDNRDGFACSSCEDNYFLAVDDCLVCPKATYVFPVVAAIACCLFVIIVHSMTDIDFGRQEGRLAIAEFIYHVQLIAVLFTFDFKLPSLLTNYLSVTLNYIGFNIGDIFDPTL